MQTIGTGEDFMYVDKTEKRKSDKRFSFKAQDIGKYRRYTGIWNDRQGTIGTGNIKIKNMQSPKYLLITG